MAPTVTRNNVRQIRKLYLEATPRTIQGNVNKAVELLKSLPTESARQEAAVYMDGLSQLRSEWTLAKKRRAKHR
ncbi:MAG: hypothetical protein QF507_03795 [Vicinamibacterales bacterium]|jgi:hypothetical protein|nr:hypothetical protein [Vicinamibacterales bacterium]